MASSERAHLNVVREPLREVDGEALVLGLRSSLAWLQANQEQVNDLNVFPVPDGDTGSNMYLTLRSAVEEAGAATPKESAAAVMKAAAHGSLMGARGNSGVILSQIFRGFAQGVAESERLDAQAVARGLTEAARVAYKAVMKPTEGTILTVVREAGDSAQRAANESDDVRHVLDCAVRDAHVAVEKTIDQLQVLRDANVVDAGGFGFAVVLEGFARALAEGGTANLPVLTPLRPSGEPRVKLPGEDNGEHRQERRGAAAVAEVEGGFGYCTEFLIHGKSLDVDRLRGELGAMGDSALVVGDDEMVRVHIHTFDPAALIAQAAQRGRLAKLKVEDMSQQHHDVLERAAAGERQAASAKQLKELGAVAVAPGEGFRKILESLGCDAVVEGGQTMNPSIEDLLTAVRSAHAKRVVILPNNGNVILTAEQVNALADDVEVAVVPTRNLPQGIAAMLAMEPGGSLETNVEKMRDATKSVSSIEVTTAVRNSVVNGMKIKTGDVIALVDDEIIQTGNDYGDVVEAVLRNHEGSPELVTIYWGAEVTEAQAQQLQGKLHAAFSDTEFELHHGGQEHYPYVLSLE